MTGGIDRDDRHRFTVVRFQKLSREFSKQRRFTGPGSTGKTHGKRILTRESLGPEGLEEIFSKLEGVLSFDAGDELCQRKFFPFARAFDKFSEIFFTMFHDRTRTKPRYAAFTV